MDGLNGYNSGISAYSKARVAEEEGTSVIGSRSEAKDKENGVSVDDFLNLMVAQLRNQDFMNPVDDTQYVTQLAQFATMQQMQNMAYYMKTNFVMSYVGKTVTAARIGPNGELQKETGRVERLSLVNNDYYFYVNGKRFTLEQIMEVHSSESEKPDTDNNSQMPLLLSLINKEVTVKVKNSETGEFEEITGIVEKVSTEDGKNKIMIDDKWYNLSDVTAVGKDEGSSPEENPEVKPDTDGSGETVTPDVENPETEGGSTDKGEPDSNSPKEEPDVKP